ncbi:MAG TPA: hypothetical protein VGO47_04195, partial [Chlamydiales bacterium]|nr:hypothetical protein [Chlamydiales bacterium]
TYGSTVEPAMPAAGASLLSAFDDIVAEFNTEKESAALKRKSSEDNLQEAQPPKRQALPDSKSFRVSVNVFQLMFFVCLDEQVLNSRSVHVAGDHGGAMTTAAARVPLADGGMPSIQIEK